MHQGTISIFLFLILVSVGIEAVNRNEPSSENNEYSQYKNSIGSSAYRLPTNVVPISYDLRILTKLAVGNFTYDGEVSIVLKVLEKTNTVVVHADTLTIWKKMSSVFTGIQNFDRKVPLHDQFYDHEKQFYIVRTATDLIPGFYTLTLFFTGEIRDDVFGFYRSSYKVNGKTKWLGVTQFSPTYARRAFPCMDEPGLKATFIIHIGHHDNITVTSNTRVDRTIKINDNYYVTTFLPTPKMSTYLVGWAVHNLIPQTSDLSQNFRIWTRETMTLRGLFALNRGQSIYVTLSNWMATTNPIEKMDQIVVPDFNFNAMENWGMITYRETVVLHENKTSPIRNTIRGLTTMAHEYAHTWFGNLVTPKFWDVVWLKEGFASYFQYLGIDLIEPTWEIMNMFVVDNVQPTMLADSEEHNRTMNGRNVGSPSSIMDTLDFVSYRKGASIIRMISHSIGESVFQKGLRSYIKYMSFEAATPSDLYRHLQRAIDQSDGPHVPIDEVIESWASQTGYPLVTVTRDYTSNSIKVAQEKFYLDGKPIKSKNHAWWIPLTIATESKSFDFDSTTPSYWLTPKDRNKDIVLPQPEFWVLFNVQQVGYYRVNYDKTNWKRLIDYLMSKNYTLVSKTNRAALLDDTFNLARAGYVDYSIPFNLSRYLARESQYEPWVAAVDNLKFLDRILTGTSIHEKLQKFIRELLRPIYNSLGFKGILSDARTQLHRELILSASCSVNNSHCLKKAELLFRSWINTQDNRVPADFKSFVYCMGIRFGNKSDWDIVWNRFVNADLHVEQELLLNGLGCTRNSDLIYKYLNTSISSDAIRKQYRTIIVDSVLNGNPQNVNNVLFFVQKNLESIIKKRGYKYLNKILSGIGGRITKEQNVKQFREFVEKNRKILGSSMDTAMSAVKKATQIVAWIKKYSPKIAANL